ncbi:hypothetical protein ACVV62_02945 [Streptococcus pluranimalium]
MSKTIKEIAEELGYSKTYISQTLKKEGLQSSLRKIGNKFLIDEGVEILLKQSLEGELQTKNENRTESKSQIESGDSKNRKLIKSTLIEALREESQSKIENSEVFDFLKEQLKEKNQQLTKKR